MKIQDSTLKEILLQGNYIDKNDVSEAEKYAQKNRTPFLEYFFINNLLTKDLVGQAIAETLEVPYMDLNSHMPSKEQVLLIEEEIARKYSAVVFNEDKNEVMIASDEPDKKEELEKVLKEIFAKKKISIGYALSEDIEASFKHYRKSLQTRFAKIIESQKRIAPEIINDILDDALSLHASDIHFEPREKEVVIRFRIDGVLHEAGTIQKKYYENILNRLKVQAHLRIDEHFSAQDGSIHYTFKNSFVDLRVSVVPTVDGEKIVLRLLSVYINSLSLGELGFLKNDEDLISKASKKPFGMILVTGPTGSGKTTTLYALLKNIDRVLLNVTTIEDPVEYKMDGINQIQVNQKAGLTFASGLRSIVRQDPDVILVGEIRDEETAEISVNAALTGHLLFSTFHANDAATAIPRLLDMKVEPFLLASTLELIVAQRLARKICENCRCSEVVKTDELKKMFPEAEKYFSQEETLYHGKGCETCNGTGYQGRTAFFEIIEMTAEIRDLILQRPSSKQIWAIASSQGAHTLFQDGIEKVKSGVTTMEELLRVANPPQQTDDEKNRNKKDKTNKLS